jgi:general secretion pathway protein D
MHAISRLSPVRLPAGGRQLWAAGLVALLMAGCASQPPRSAAQLTPPDNVAAEKLKEQMVLESRRLLEHQQSLQAGLNKAAPVPALQPRQPVFDPLEGKLINVTMSKASISQILQAFADAGKLNLIVDPAVLKGGQLADMHLRQISLREGFNEVMRTYDVAGEFRGNTLRVNLHEEKFFSVNFLNSKTSIQMGSGGNVFGSNAGGGSSAQQGSLTLSAAGGFSVDPYVELESALKSILGNPLQAANGATLTPAAAPAGVPGGVTQGALATGATVGEDGGFTMNKMSGALYIKARPSRMRAVEKMLAQMHKALGKQVYVEAQLIDVQLSDNFEFGVDWNHLRSRLAAGFGASPMQLGGSSTTLPNAGAGYADRALTIPASLLGSATGPSMGLSYQGSNYGVVISALRSFGNLKILSNPNIQVRNGTPALLSVGSSTRYVSQSSTTQTAPGGGATTTSTNVQTDTVFSGVMVGVLPLVREDGRIELMVNPMQSDVDAASLQLVRVGGDNLVSLPQVSYKGLTTTLNVADGDVVVVGGLIDQRNSGNDRGAPGIADVPVIGRLFANENQTHRSRELVVVMRVRVL